MDKEIWLGISNGDKEAFSQAYPFVYKRLYNYGRKITGDIPLIEDAVQEVLMDMWRNRKKLTEVSAITAYYYSAFRYTLLRKLKQQRRSLQLNQSEDIEFSVDHFIARRETELAFKEQLQAAMKKLTDRQREAIFLRFYENFSYEEVSEIMNISVKGTYKLMARALQELREGMSFPAFAMIFLKQIIDPQLF